ncbi:MAG: ATP-binding protein [Pseudobdellovibrio sp.]
MYFIKILSNIFGLLKNIPGIVYKVFFALIFSVLITNFKFDSIEFFLYDVRNIIKSELGFAKPKMENIVMVYTDANTIEKYNGFPNFKIHQEFLNRLSKLKNSYILYNYRIESKQFSDIDGSYEDKSQFARIANQIPNLYFITQELALRGQESTLQLSIPLNTLQMASGPKTNDQQFNSKNPISRRILIDYEGQLLIHQKLASIFNPEIKDSNKIHGSYFHIGTNQAYITFNKPGSFPIYKFEDIVDGKISPELLENKIILVGTHTNKQIEDYSSTPFSSDTKDLITVTELQANMFNTLIENNAPIKTPNYINIIITTLIAILTVYVALSVKPSIGIAILLSTFLGLSVLSMTVLIFLNIWIDMAHPLLTIFLCYYFFIPYRLILENRKSWEYIQKNKLLQQVEELKTNFISMMSHDLKTPIARIQGMTEVILKDNVALSSVQREAVDTIKGSSDDLLKFINSILQYGRIESNGVELHKQSKDVNQVLQDVIKKHEFLSKVKKIKVITELEPMFPIQIDVDLMKQVFSNLIENAIKYSHEESTVTVKSREEGSNVIVEVTDNGVGIPVEDLPNIFMKFYRSHNVKTSTIKGSGLGLYLAQYFTQLHKGEITVTSEKDKGSTFKVTLPA